MAILLMCVSRNMRRVDFSQVDGKSTGPPVLGRHIVLSKLQLNCYKRAQEHSTRCC